MIEDPALAHVMDVLTGQVVLTGSDFTLPLAAGDDLPAVIGLCGAAGAGKDSVVAWLVAQRGYTRLAFADPLRAALAALDPYVATHEAMIAEPERLSAVLARVGWEVAKRTFPEVRRLLQALGTDVGRAMIDEDLWVTLALGAMEPGRRYAISDVRFSNEVALIKTLSRDNVVVEVKRPGHERGEHASENGITEGEIDMRLTNSADLADLHNLLAIVFPTREG